MHSGCMWAPRTLETSETSETKTKCPCTEGTGMYVVAKAKAARRNRQATLPWWLWPALCGVSC